MKNTIDFILPWVDGSDPNWIAEKTKHKNADGSASTAPDAISECRYRDNGLLKYWFRGVESFAPWVNHVFFVTCGQKPEWLNANHPKLILVDHRDYIPHQFLPTFNSNTIEMNYHRIEGVSERLVFFNDDKFLLRPIDETVFFADGLPVLDTRILYPPKNGEHNWERELYNDYCIVNKSYNRFETAKSIWRNRSKWFNLSVLGRKRVLGNITHFLTNGTLPATDCGHLALPHLKSSLEELWANYPDVLAESSSHKFRNDGSVNQCLINAWEQAKGMFYPVHKKDIGMYLDYSEENQSQILYYINNQMVPQICLNESEKSWWSESFTSAVVQAFDSILPNKSSFEL